MSIFNKKGVSVIEYVLLFVIIIGAFIIMKNYIQRGANGKWAAAGQSFAYGRQYDPQQTVDCAFDDQVNQWYDNNCLQYYNNLYQCNNVGSNYCADNSTCGATIAGQCANNSLCGPASCQENIITTGTCSASNCSQIQ